MSQIKKIGAFSLAKVLAAINFAVGVLISIYLLISGYLINMGLASTFRSLILIGIPLLYLVLGFVSGLIMGVIYNFVAPKIGGIEIEIA